MEVAQDPALASESQGDGQVKRVTISLKAAGQPR